jgi:hypothetical protein
VATYWPHKDAQCRRLLRIVEPYFGKVSPAELGSIIRRCPLASTACDGGSYSLVAALSGLVRGGNKTESSVVPSRLVCRLFFGHAPEPDIAATVSAVGEVRTEEGFVLRFGLDHALHEFRLVLIVASDCRVIERMLVLLPTHGIFVPPRIALGFLLRVPMRANPHVAPGTESAVAARVPSLMLKADDAGWVFRGFRWHQALPLVVLGLTCRANHVGILRYSAAALRQSGHSHSEQTYSHPQRDPRGRVVTTAFLAIAPRLPEAADGTDAYRVARIEVEASLRLDPVRLAFDHGVISSRHWTVRAGYWNTGRHPSSAGLAVTRRAVKGVYHTNASSRAVRWLFRPGAVWMGD